jgi:hypothetical protein
LTSDGGGECELDLRRIGRFIRRVRRRLPILLLCPRSWRGAVSCSDNVDALCHGIEWYGEHDPDRDSQGQNLLNTKAVSPAFTLLTHGLLSDFNESPLAIPYLLSRPRLLSRSSVRVSNTC